MQRDNKMGVMPINKLLISMALPMMLSMAVQSMYNIVDSIFVSKLSENALTALTLAFPMQNMMISVFIGLGVGTGALLSRSLGERNYEKANTVAGQGILLAACGFLLFFFVGLFAIPAYMRLQTDITEIIDLGTDYLRIFCMCSFGMAAELYAERLLQSTGRTFYTMILQINCTVINLILAPILIFGWLGLPSLGVKGAAIAAVASQTLGAMLGIWMNRKKNGDVSLNLKTLRPDWKIIREILYIGVPSIIMIAIGSLMGLGMNRILLGFTSTAAAVFGVYSRLQSFAFMPVFGINNGMVPIVAYNYGARNRARMTETIRLSIIYAVAVMVVCFFLMQFFPRSFLSLFSASENMMEIGVPALRAASFSFLIAGFSIVTSSMFQALGNGVYSMAVSIARQLVVLLPVAWLFSVIGGLNLVWWAIPVAEVVSVVPTVFLMIRIYNKKIKTI